MGGTSSRPKTYQQYYQSLDTLTEGGVGVDPYDVLGVSRDFAWEDLTSAYRKLARMVHPDKGSPEEQEVRTKMFKIATQCFRELAHEYKMRREGDRSHLELRQEAQSYYKANPMKERAPPQQRDGGSGSGSGSAESFLDRFNRTFQENKLDDEETEVGYGSIMAKSSKDRETIEIPQLLNKFNKDSFNSTFEKTTLSKTQDVIVYQEPEALPMARNIAYTELGGSKPDDYSSSREGIHSRIDYTDYMKAHTTTRLVDPRSVKERREYKNVDAYEADRARIASQPVTQEELAWRKKQEDSQRVKEEERLRRLSMRDTQAAEHHDRMNRLMLSAERRR